MVGIKSHEFWDMTMRELMICLEAYELMHYGIVDGKKVSDSNHGCSTHEEWLEKVWGPAYEKGVKINMRNH